MQTHSLTPPFRFQPMSNSWVALHPNPKGVIQFIGGAFFGSWPTLFYRYLLRYFFEHHYTIIALPFRFSFRHWSIAATLFAEQKNLQPLLIQAAKRQGYEGQIYTQPGSYAWLGHSMGCKYIALLECLSTPEWESLLAYALGAKTASTVIPQLKRFDLLQPVEIIDQASVLLAPDISDTVSAIPVKSIARLLDNFQLGVLPTRLQTQRLIQASQLFNLTGLISFERDRIAGSISNADQPDPDNDVAWILDVLKSHPRPAFAQDLPGKHLEPMGLTWRHRTWNPFGFLKRNLSQRLIEPTAQDFFEQL